MWNEYSVSFGSKIPRRVSEIGIGLEFKPVILWVSGECEMKRKRELIIYIIYIVVVVVLI